MKRKKGGADAGAGAVAGATAAGGGDTRADEETAAATEAEVAIGESVESVGAGGSGVTMTVVGGAGELRQQGGRNN